MGSGPALGWAHRGLSAAAVFPLSALLGHWHAPLMFPLLLLPAFCTCCSSGFADEVVLQQVVPKPFPFAGQVLQPLPSGLAGGRAALHCRLLLQSKGAARLWLQWRRGEELSSVLSVKLMATLLSHPFLCTLPDVH